MRLGFIVKAKNELIESLKSQGNDLHEYFSENYILATEEDDFESAFEGYNKSIVQSAKNIFINETVLNCLEMSTNEMLLVFGEYSSNIELFDKWWILETADCDIIPTTWLSK